MYKWFLALRYLQTKLIAFLAVLCVTLGVALLLVVVSVMGGFLDTVRARSQGLHSEIVLDSQSLQGFPYYAEFAEYLAAELPDVVGLTTPVIYSYGIFRVPATAWTRLARVVGIHYDDYIKVNDFEQGLHYEKYFPGTTHLGLQQMPVASFGEDGTIRLPRDLQEANAKWRAEETDQEAIADFEAAPYEYAIYPDVVTTTKGERVFAAELGPARYAGPERYGIIVGCDLLNERREDGNFNRYNARGTDVALALMPLSRIGTTTGEPPIRVPLRYVDDSRTGIFEIDDFCVYVDFDMLQQKTAMDPQEMADGGFTMARTNQLLVDIKDDLDLYAARQRIQAAWAQFRSELPSDLSFADTQALDPVKVLTWEELQGDFIAAIEKEKVLVTLMFGCIFVVVIVLVLCIFYMIVEKKTRDIGILKSLGASSAGVASMFILYATVVGIVGSILGSVAGTSFVWNVNGIQDWLAQLNPQLRVWSPTIYSFDKIPEVVKQGDVIWISAVAIVSSIAGALIPAWIASRVWPVEALRYE